MLPFIVKYPINDDILVEMIAGCETLCSELDMFAREQEPETPQSDAAFEASILEMALERRLKAIWCQRLGRVV